MVFSSVSHFPNMCTQPGFLSSTHTFDVILVLLPSVLECTACHSNVWVDFPCSCLCHGCFINHSSLLASALDTVQWTGHLLFTLARQLQAGWQLYFLYILYQTKSNLSLKTVQLPSKSKLAQAMLRSALAWLRLGWLEFLLINMSSSWVDICLHTKFLLLSLPRPSSFGLNHILAKAGRGQVGLN